MHDVLTRIGQHRIVPVIVLEDAAHAAPLADALVAGGLPVAEITFRTAAAQASIRTMADRGDMIVGAGTVLTPEHVDRAIDAGASFLVSPGTNPRVIEHAQKRGIPITPGIATPTDIELAGNLGLDVLKFFPAGAYGGVATLKALSAPYRHVKFIPTGGIEPKDLPSYLALPSVLAVGGSWVVKPALLAENRFDKIQRLTAEAVAMARLAG